MVSKSERFTILWESCRPLSPRRPKRAVFNSSNACLRRQRFSRLYPLERCMTEATEDDPFPFDYLTQPRSSTFPDSVKSSLSGMLGDRREKVRYRGYTRCEAGGESRQEP